MKKRLYLFFTIILPISFNSCSKFDAGSYPYAELYELNYPESQIIKAIQVIKAKSPELQVAGDLIDIDSTDHWHHEWFTVGDRMIMTWTSPSEKDKTTFALISVGTMGDWREVNHDLSYSEDSKIKKQFQELILDKLIIELKSGGSH